MIGDQDDAKSRLWAQLPFGWFGDDEPVVSALLEGYAWAVSCAYSLLAYAKAQTRISTASGGWLDLISADFFGRKLLRKVNQTDDSFRARIQAALFRQRTTREGLRQALLALTGQEPFIFEPARPADTGGYGVACGYGAAGGYGSVTRPHEAFVIAQRPIGQGIASVAGYGVSTAGYGVGQVEYATLSMLQDAVTDQDIYDAVNDVRPVGTTIWVAIGATRATSDPNVAYVGQLNFGDPNASGLAAL